MLKKIKILFLNKKKIIFFKKKKKRKETFIK